MMLGPVNMLGGEDKEWPEVIVTMDLYLGVVGYAPGYTWGAEELLIMYEGDGMATFPFGSITKEPFPEGNVSAIRVERVTGPLRKRFHLALDGYINAGYISGFIIDGVFMPVDSIDRKPEGTVFRTALNTIPESNEIAPWTLQLQIVKG